MIEIEEIQEIDEQYFLILARNPYCILLRSRNTGHYWHLLERLANGHRTFVISHRHNGTGPYHLQANRPSVASCCEYIRQHDDFHIERERRKKERRLRRLGLIEGEELQEQPKKKKRERRVLQTKSGEKIRKSLDVKDIRMVK